ncbi:hypothetical protein Taro_026931 [Colocasia esculenta]|uniref:Uncharacterized protein n=1 Tax=Colocasia esculenta TaxID=4460 RepID=A0A843VCP3_COLES|nr:hypothetical protein [Colocasia esculenta]
MVATVRPSFARCSALKGLSRVRELSWVVWVAEDNSEFYPVQAIQSFFSLPRSLWPRNRLERPDFPTAAERASGGGVGAVGVVPVASSGFPVSVYVTLGPFRVSGSVGGDRENWVHGVGRGSGSQSSRDWFGTPRTFRGLLPGADQLVLVLTASLLVAPEPLGEARRGTVVRPDYGGYCETSQQRQGARWAEETGRPFGSPDPWAATAKIGSSAWAEGRVLGSLHIL